MKKQSNKAPAFQFYYDRFNSSTSLWTDEQVGKYIRLLIVQANDGFVTQRHLDRVVPDRDDYVLSKFEEVAPGKFANSVLSGILTDRDAYRASRAENRKKGIEKKKTALHDDHMNVICSSYDDHMVVVDVDVDKVKEKKVKGGVGEKPIDMIPVDWPKDQFSELWAEYVEMRTKAKKPLTKNAVKRRISELVGLSGGSYQTAEKIALKAIDKGWDRFYELFPDRNGVNGVKVGQKMPVRDMP